jgi:hypothetical protein
MGKVFIRSLSSYYVLVTDNVGKQRYIRVPGYE